MTHVDPTPGNKPSYTDPVGGLIAKKTEALNQTFIALLDSLFTDMQDDPDNSSAFQRLQSAGKFPEELAKLLKPVTANDPYAKAWQSKKINDLANASGVSVDDIRVLQSAITSDHSLVDKLIKFAFETNPSYQPRKAPPKTPSLKDLAAQNASSRAIQAARREQARREEELGGLL